jgi:hypothetical protein
LRDKKISVPKNLCNAGRNFPKEKVKANGLMKTKIARHISPGAIAIALFLAVALLTHGSTITVTNTNDSGLGSVRKTLVHPSNGGHAP